MQRPKFYGVAMLSCVIHDCVMVGAERIERGVDLCRRIQAAEVALRERAVAFPALWRMKQEVDVVLAARHLVEEMNMVNVRPPIDVIVIVSLPNCPHIVYPVVPSLITSRPPLPPML